MCGDGEVVVCGDGEVVVCGDREWWQCVGVVYVEYQCW